jgi:hypothetical protein
MHRCLKAVEPLIDVNPGFAVERRYLLLAHSSFHIANFYRLLSLQLLTSSLIFSSLCLPTLLLLPFLRHS